MQSLWQPFDNCRTDMIVQKVKAGERAFSPSVVSRNVQAWNLSNVLHGQDSQFVRFYPRKTRKSRQFWQQLKNGGFLTHIFRTDCQFFSIQIQTNSSCFVKSYDNSSLQ